MAGEWMCKGPEGLKSQYAQILFYPNSGIVNADGQGFVSLYLACEVGICALLHSILGKFSYLRSLRQKKRTTQSMESE